MPVDKHDSDKSFTLSPDALGETKGQIFKFRSNSVCCRHFFTENFACRQKYIRYEPYQTGYWFEGNSPTPWVDLSPYLTGLRLFCDIWRQTSRVARKVVSKQSPVIRNFLACVAKWRKVVAKILNMFKNFMRQNSSQNRRKVIAGVSNPSRTCRRPLAI